MSRLIFEIIVYLVFIYLIMTVAYSNRDLHSYPVFRVSKDMLKRDVFSVQDAKDIETWAMEKVCTRGHVWGLCTRSRGPFSI